MKILIVEDEVEYGWLLAKFLREKGHLTEHVARCYKSDKAF